MGKLRKEWTNLKCSHDQSSSGCSYKLDNPSKQSIVKPHDDMPGRSKNGQGNPGGNNGIRLDFSAGYCVCVILCTLILHLIINIHITGLILSSTERNYIKGPWVLTTTKLD
jgi:hypothetical protein